MHPPIQKGIYSVIHQMISIVTHSKYLTSVRIIGVFEYGSFLFEVTNRKRFIVKHSTFFYYMLVKFQKTCTST